MNIMPPAAVDRFLHSNWEKKSPRGSYSCCYASCNRPSVVHLAFIIDPQRSGVLDVERMWQSTSRVLPE